MRCFKMTFLFLFWFVGVLSVVCEPENQLLVITMNVFTMQYVHFLNTNCIFTENSNNNWVIRVLIHGIIGGPRLEPGFESQPSVSLTKQNSIFNNEINILRTLLTSSQLQANQYIDQPIYSETFAIYLSIYC